MNLLDIMLLLAVVGYAASGYWQGFLVGASSTVGFLVGGFAGIALAPSVLDDFGETLAVSVAALAGVLLLASIGQVVGSFVGRLVRSFLTWKPARAIDSAGGAALSVVAALVVAWALGYAVSGARIPWLGNQVRGSTVLSSVDEVMPDAAAETLGGYEEVVGSDLFPRILEPFVPERIVDVPAPDAAVLGDADVARAEGSVVKVLGEARQCNRGLEGSGFVYAPGRVMTNAHVVAGASRVVVEVGDEQLPAGVVLFDPELDVAVLAVEGLTAPALRFDESGRAGDAGAVLGFPENGPFNGSAARIRAEQALSSPDIYEEGTSVRDVFSIRSAVRPGNSGGPLVSTDGRVYGVVFAASVTDSSTGYALTAEQVSDAAAEGRTGTFAVSTGGCA